MKAGVSCTIPVKLQATWGAYPGTPNVSYTVLTCSMCKADGTFAVKALDGTLWAQVQSFYMPGQYRLGMHSHEFDQAGWVSVTITGPTGIRQYDDRFELVTYSDVDIGDDVTSVQDTVDTITTNVSAVKQAVMGKQKLDLSASPPEHTIYDTDGATVLQQADVLDDMTERSYTPK